MFSNMKILSLVASFIFMFMTVSMVIMMTNPVYSLISLIVSFINLCVTAVCREVDFIGRLFIVVYVGAIAVLFIFVVMILNFLPYPRIYSDYFSFLIYVFTCFIVVSNVSPIYFVSSFQNSDLVYYFDWVQYVDIHMVINSIGFVLYTYYVLYLLVVGIVLLVSRLGPLILTINPLLKIYSKRQNISDQFNRKSVVNMKSNLI